MIRVVNMMPAALSGESRQDSEPNIAVNPANPTDIVGTAFTPAAGGSFAPIYVSVDGGLAWSLRNVVPGNGFVGTGDITVGFATRGGMLYAGTLNGTTGHLQIMRTSGPTSTTPMTVLVDRANEDQPWVVAGSVVVSGASVDRVFVGSNDFNQPSGQTGTVDRSADAATQPAPAGFAPFQLEHRTTSGQDGPPVRIALHPSGVVYAAFHRWVTNNGSNITIDVVVTRDDAWGTSASPFRALVDSGDGVIGQRVATGRFIRFNDTMGQERLGADLAITVDPTDANTVYIAWCDRVGGSAGTDWTIHLRRSTDGGQNWSGDLRTITNAKNPALAINSQRVVGFAYQQFTGTRWVTQLEVTADGWASAATTMVLHTAPSNTPARAFFPYIGDYIRLLAVDVDFYGVFSGSNSPDLANFPSGILYQRNANWTTHTLLAADNATAVASSIDPFFFHFRYGDPAGYMFDAQGTKHVVYRGGDGHIRELWWNADQGWHLNDLTAATGAAGAAGDPAGYMFDAQGTQHVVYRGGDGHIRELWWNADQGWHLNDLTAATGAVRAAGDPAAYMFDAQGTQHVFYRSRDGHIRELWWNADQGWHATDLTAATGALAPNA